MLRLKNRGDAAIDIYDLRQAHRPSPVRVRDAACTTSPYTTDGWLSRRHHHRDVVANPAPSNLPDDALFEIFSRVSCAADMPPLGPRGGRARRSHLPRRAQQPQETSPTLVSLTKAAPACYFDHARPVASRNGRVVLELRRADGLTLSVWNPMTGHVSVLPTLSASKRLPWRLRVRHPHRRRPRHAALVVDGGPVPPPPHVQPPGLNAAAPGDRISSTVLGQLGPAVVLRGVAYWHTCHGALGVRLDDVCFLPYKGGYCKLDEHVLAVSPDGTTLRFVEAGFTGATQVPVITFSTSVLKGPDYDSTTGGFYDATLDEHIHLPQIKATRATRYKQLWFGEKSGTLIFAVVDRAGSST
ncbi:hypothetical protein HU200_017155 [Digitaria exilis]|uniref:Uncharacterized protein n=1 Tax=Digitaria exilis TaxID=1010633 RepID=A0A835F6J9_9POAL|nr:hypothetical protein HU200_017155 [Digitaria exilis]